MKPKTIALYLLLITFLILNSAVTNARPPMSAFDTEPATVAEAEVADSRCTQYGKKYDGTSGWVVASEKNLYACATLKGTAEATLSGGIKDVRFVDTDFFVAVGGVDVAGVLSKRVNKITKEVSVIFTPDTPIASGTAVAIIPQSDLEVWDGTSWNRLGVEIYFYVLMP
jgi:hypothetical protein